MRILKYLWVCVLLSGTVCISPGQDQASSKKQQSKEPGATDALEFLGSTSAPTAIMATETGHTSARPPSPPTNARLRRIEGGVTLLPPWPPDFTWSMNSLQAACSRTAAPPEPGEASPANPRAERSGSFGAEILQADTSLKSGRFREASAVYKHILRMQPDCAPARWNLVLSKVYGGFPSALADLIAALPDAPAPNAARLLVGLERLVDGDVEGARKELPSLEGGNEIGGNGQGSKTRDIDPPARDAAWARAILAWATGDPVAARKTLSHLLAPNSESPALWFVMGGVLLEEARENSRRLEELAPASDWNRRLEGDALAARHPELSARLQSSERTADSAITPSAAPGQDSKKIKIGNTEGTLSSPPENSELDLQRLESYPDSPEVFYLRTRAALHLSEQAYARAAQSPLFNAQLSALRALAAEEGDDPAAAIREYRAGLIENPQSALLHAGLGHLYRAQTQLVAAQAELSQASSLDPADPVVAFELGDVYQRMAQPNHALPLLNRALELDPGLLVARWSRGKAYRALGDNQRAIADLEAAAPCDKSGDLQWQLARLYQKVDRPDLANRAQKLSDKQRRAVEETKRKAMDVTK